MNELTLAFSMFVLRTGYWPMGGLVTFFNFNFTNPSPTLEWIPGRPLGSQPLKKGSQN